MAAPAAGEEAHGRSRPTAASSSALFAPCKTFRTSDGYITVEGTGPAGAWERFCDALEAPHLVDDEWFRSNASRLANLDALRHEVESRPTRNPPSRRGRHSALRGYRTIRGPVRYDGQAATISGTPALGEHIWEALSELGLTADALTRFQDEGVISPNTNAERR